VSPSPTRMITATNTVHRRAGRRQQHHNATSTKNAAGSEDRFLKLLVAQLATRIR
jgi:flagellar hook assembly protein FlgD